MFWRSLLTQYVYSSTGTPFILCHCAKYKVSALQARISEEKKLNATTQKFITAKISRCTLKKGSKTHSSQRQSNLQLQNQAALYYVEFEQSSIESVRLDWLAHTPICKIESC